MRNNINIKEESDNIVVKKIDNIKNKFNNKIDFRVPELNMKTRDYLENNNDTMLKNLFNKNITNDNVPWHKKYEINYSKFKDKNIENEK